MKLFIYSVLFLFVFNNVGCNSSNSSTISTIPNPSITADAYRPTYHFTADSNWINDPNGLVYHDGEYHLFYQHNPFAAKWGHISWGHSVSKDLIHWKTLPVAMYEDKNPNDNDTTMIFSGSAVIDKNNTSGFANGSQKTPLVAVYTSFVHNKFKPKVQHQSIAYSNDDGLTWTKYAGNPVVDIQSLEFRDPKVFWYEPQQKWVMVVLKAEQREAQFYSSKNLKDWVLISTWGKVGNTARVWECPDLVELPVKGTNEKKWVFIVSAGHAQDGYVGMQYFIGNFDGTSFTPDHDYKQPTYLDFGKDFYAAVTYNNAPNDRKILVAWMNNWEYANEIPTGNVWRGSYAIPRELSLVRYGNEIKLIQQPVTEMNALKQEAFAVENKQVEDSFDLPYKGDAYQLEIIIDPGEAKAAGLKLLKSKNEVTIIKYDNNLKQLQLDRSKSGNVNFHPKFSSVEQADVSLVGGKIKLNILVDKSVIEVFANDGLVTISDLVFPLEKEGGIQLFSEGGKANFQSVKIWRMKAVK
ncbi:glycoside hydrolase family 32 protein [Terrimonas alba]|uniref:glycoside hydrolase family 32 protein n=1 Tax=Terrimonas alba TaxID=3349636 RepID=UPI0035F2D37C